MTKTELQQEAKLSWASIAKLNRGENIGTDILLRICGVLNCGLEDIMEISKEEHQKIQCNLSLIRDELQKTFSKICIDNPTIKKDEVQKDIEEYYIQKFNTLTDSDFKFDFIDLFCGAGGLSIGLECEGFRPIKAIDKDSASLRTYHFNRPWMPSEALLHEDISNLNLKKAFPYAPVIVGGPPCQGFSVVNQHKKDNDERNELYKFFVKVVAEVRPKVFLMENVEGILQIIELIRKDFINAGFHVCDPLILSPKDFGFPQSRRRAFILGINGDYKGIADELFNVFSQTIDSYKHRRAFTLWDAISDLPPLSAKTAKNSTNLENDVWGYTFVQPHAIETEYAKLVNQGLPELVPLLNHKAKYNNERDIQIYETLKPGEKSDAESIQSINPYKNRADIFRDKFDKLLADEPCKAITAHMYYDCNMYIHPFQARGLTPREAARIQGFPDDYLFLGSPNEWYRQIGNAVSPLVARVLGCALLKVLEKMK